jgi:hypothetical protein
MSARIKGTGLVLEIDGVDYYADCVSAVLENEEAAAAVTTFADAAAGGARQFYFAIEAIQSPDSASLWSKIWDNTGDVVNYTFAPTGNDTPGTNNPVFTGTVKIPVKPAIGGTASATGEYTFTTRFDCQQEPTIDRTP